MVQYCQITFTNNTRRPLVYDSPNPKEPEWGGWDVNFLIPPDRIAPGETLTWATRGDLTGVEMDMYYRIDLGRGIHGGYVLFRWNMPLSGDNDYEFQAPSIYNVQRDPIGEQLQGGRAIINWTLTDRCSSDDGIPDDWKLNGRTENGQFVNLPAMGAVVGQRDIFIQIDHFADAAHSHEPTLNALKLVHDAFLAHGILLHIDAGASSIMTYPSTTWGSLSQARTWDEDTTNVNLGTGDYDWTAFNGYKTRATGFTSTGRASIFRYCLAAHFLSTQLGGNVIGNSRRRGLSTTSSDFVVSLGTRTPTDVNWAVNFMHELGHCLSLNHAGDQGEEKNYKPNYLSIMNYAHSFEGLTRNRVPGIVDYSGVTLPTLRQKSLDEPTGLGPLGLNQTTVRWSPSAGPMSTGARISVEDTGTGINWDDDSTGDTTSTGFAADILGTGASLESPVGDLTGFNDWDNLILVGGLVGTQGGPGSGVTLPNNNISEEKPLTEILAGRLPNDLTPPSTIATLNPPPNAQGWNNTEVVISFTATDDISGVARTEYILDSASSWTRYTAPVRVTNEGTTSVSYRSVDRSQNIEAIHHLMIKIDKTPPEAIISYDPFHHKVQVIGVDSLSGVTTQNPLIPFQVTDLLWTSNGSNPGQARSYRVEDAASNVLELFLNVRCEPDEYEVELLRLVYNGNQDLALSPRNTIMYRRIRGLDHHRTLLGTFEQVSIGKDDERASVRKTWDVLHDLTETLEWNGGGCCDYGGVEAGSVPPRRGRVGIKVRTDSRRLLLEENHEGPIEI